MNKKNRLHQLTSQSGGQMMSYVVETADNKIIVIDGGRKNDAEYLLGYIKNITGCDKAHVDAWLLTHAHSDHVDAFMELCAQNEMRSDLTVDRVYYNYPPFESAEKYEPGDAHTVKEFDDAFGLLSSRTDMVKFEDGMKFGVGCAFFELLYVPDHTIQHNYINNTSSVFRMKLGEKTFMFLGDLGVEGGQIMLGRHGSYLKSDYAQMAHHGQNGVDRPVYEAIAPTGCLWDTPQWLWDNNAGKGYNTHVWKTIIVKGWMDELGVKEHYITKDGTNVVEI